MARIFQDAAGTIPVTTFDQPVGKIVRGAGTVDLVQGVSASRPTMARWPRGGRRTLLRASHFKIIPPNNEGPFQVYSSDGSAYVDGWDSDVVTLHTFGSSNQYITSNASGSSTPDGSNRDLTDTIPANTPITVSASYRLISSSTRLRFTTLFYSQEDSPLVGYSSGNTGFNGSNPPGSLNPVSEPDGFTRLSYTFTKSDKSLFAAFLYMGITNSYSGVVQWTRPQIEIGPEPTAYQYARATNDVTEEGVESLWHLYNDGGDSLQTDGPVPAGTYGYAWIDPYGEITFDTRTSDGINPVVVADDPGRYLDIILREGDFSAGEKVAITDYWERRYK